MLLKTELCHLCVITWVPLLDQRLRAHHTQHLLLTSVLTAGEMLCFLDTVQFRCRTEEGQEENIFGDGLRTHLPPSLSLLKPGTSMSPSPGLTLNGNFRQWRTHSKYFLKRNFSPGNRYYHRGTARVLRLHLGDGSSHPQPFL